MADIGKDGSDQTKVNTDSFETLDASKFQTGNAGGGASGATGDMTACAG